MQGQLMTSGNITAGINADRYANSGGGCMTGDLSAWQGAVVTNQAKYPPLPTETIAAFKRQFHQETPMYTGKTFIVVCNGQAHQLDADASLEAAQDKAEALAHQHQSEAYILKPVRKVAPKRDVVTTDL